MKKKFRQILTRWYSGHKRTLPWRGVRDPYRIWLSEIILQQTQIAQGMPYYKTFIESFPKVEDLAKASEDEVLKLWQGLGYYSRARNLHKTAQIVTDQLNGRFPGSYKELIKLPGIGDYTASAIASICYDEASAVVDGNVYRFFSRYFGIDTPIDSGTAKSEFKNLAQELLPERDIGDHNQAVMEFGSQQCRPKNPDCQRCVYSSSCYALQHEMVDRLPVKKKKTKIRKRFFNYLIIKSKEGQKILMQKRQKQDIWKNLYEFPLVETTCSVTADDAIIEEVGNQLLNNSEFESWLYNDKDVVHKLSHQHIYAKFWIIEAEKEIETGIPISKVNSLAVPVLIQDFMEHYRLTEQA
ncbi:MAG: A/G-specific adenine glycosylase [Flavobacteriaceae bacterium]|nr:A/G-specific adenine glycosylase [Bacteroidia bacterium]MBT8287700.1 A/G-specific adenine glycosylase [Bacteroidia bacterium]NNF73943.1 A/G-specific adenine glycosylase [Flavobacteriaceae bacterium]NNK71696.1 A/G-specific adenine glycosylase [Flavobacteriaceae bacterium]